MDLCIAGAILAGGAATRMGGRAKGMLERAPGQPIIRHELDELARAGVREIIVVANEPSVYRGLGCAVVPDLRPGLGPLAGVEAALTHLAPRFHAVVFLPCDMPAITATEIRVLTDAFRAEPSTIKMVVAGQRGFYRHPACCVVPCAVLPGVTRSLDESKLKMGLLWRDLGVAEIPFADPAPFHNINTPEDLRTWLRAHSRA